MQACFSSFPYAFPIPLSPSPNAHTHRCTPHDPPGSAGLCQWTLYSGIPSQRQEPPGLVQAFPLLVMLLHTNQMLSEESCITESPNWHIMWALWFLPLGMTTACLVEPYTHTHTPKQTNQKFITILNFPEVPKWTMHLQTYDSDTISQCKNMWSKLSCLTSPALTAENILCLSRYAEP